MLRTPAPLNGTLGDMDTPTKRRRAERIRKAVTSILSAHHFARGKSTFWSRPGQDVVEFLHLHVFTFAPSFRIHCGLRVLNDDFPALALNGPNSDAYRDAYMLDFTDEVASESQCAAEIGRFCVEVAEPWFEQLRELQTLLGPDSPLSQSARSGLEHALDGMASPEAIRNSKALLGVA